jgi:predicted transport protein
MPKYTKLRTVSLKAHPDYNEAWLQDRIGEDPSILGLGPLIVKDRERTHRGAGRLDMLLQTDDGNSRYEVELQLGASDESHIIRTIEYWDRERKMYPQYEHTAVLVAEDITSRFLNVISLFNGTIPIMALQLTAVETPEGVGLVFTRVLDTVSLGLVDEDEQVSETTDRTFWEQKQGCPETVAMADEIFRLCTSFATGLTQSYKKHYIGFRLNNHPFNFAMCKPRPQNLHLEFSLPQSEELDAELTATGLDVLAYNRHFGLYRISLKSSDIDKHSDYLTGLLKRAFNERS